MKVKIQKASKPTYWYANHVGEVFEVAKYNDEDYSVLNDELYRRIVIADCEPVEDEPPKSRYEIKPYFWQFFIIDTKQINSSGCHAECLCPIYASAVKIRDALNAMEVESDDVKRMRAVHEHNKDLLSPEAYELLEEALKHVPCQANPSTADDFPCLKCRITKLLNKTEKGGK